MQVHNQAQALAAMTSTLTLINQQLLHPKHTHMESQLSISRQNSCHNFKQESDTRPEVMVMDPTLNVLPCPCLPPLAARAALPRLRAAWCPWNDRLVRAEIDAVVEPLPPLNLEDKLGSLVYIAPSWFL
jgi:hypothetical protein